jgi:hypothetical protein
MKLSNEKTTIVHARQGFDFLGVRTFIAPQRSNPTKLLPYQVPATKSVKAYRQKVKDLTHPHLDDWPLGERIRALNWLILGWSNYHHWGNAKQSFSALSHWTTKKVHKMLRRYTSEGKRKTYHKYFHPISECTNLQRWKQYTNWLTPSVLVDGKLRIGLLPMGVISTRQYWSYRGRKIPTAYPLLNDHTWRNERETEFYSDTETIERTTLGQASRHKKGKYSLTYFINRKIAFERDKYTCTRCEYQSLRQKGEVHDLEIHHINDKEDNNLNNLMTVCLPCHHQAIINSRLPHRLTECKSIDHLA